MYFCYLSVKGIKQQFPLRELMSQWRPALNLHFKSFSPGHICINSFFFCRLSHCSYSIKCTEPVGNVCRITDLFYRGTAAFNCRNVSGATPLTLFDMLFLLNLSCRLLISIGITAAFLTDFYK